MPDPFTATARNETAHPRGDPRATVSVRLQEAAKPVLARLGTITFRQVVAWMIRIVVLLCLIWVYQTITADGLRELFGDILCRRLSRVGFFLRQLGNYEETRKLDLANLVALLLMVCVWASWEAILRHA